MKASVAGVSQDDQKAFYWYEKSAQQGNSTAERLVSHFYFWGLGTPKNYKQAVYWAKKAAAHGDPKDIEILNSLKMIADSDPNGSYTNEARKDIARALSEK